jgi:transposase InsO family protein
LVKRVTELATRFGRYGYRRITALLRHEGWEVNAKRVQRIWREEGLKVPKKQPRRSRLWLADGSCIRLRPLRRNHVWSYDFVSHHTRDGRELRLLTILDELTRESLAIDVRRSFKADDVIDTLTWLFIERGSPAHLRSDNRPEFTATAIRDWLGRLKVQTLYIEPGSPWENGNNESFGRQAARRVAQRRDLLHPPRGARRCRRVAPRVQHHQAAQLAGLPASSTRGGAALRGRLRFAPPTPEHPGRWRRGLTQGVDRRPGSGHSTACRAHSRRGPRQLEGMSGAIGCC